MVYVYFNCLTNDNKNQINLSDFSSFQLIVNISNICEWTEPEISLPSDALDSTVKRVIFSHQKNFYPMNGRYRGRKVMYPSCTFLSVNCNPVICILCITISCILFVSCIMYDLSVILYPVPILYPALNYPVFCIYCPYHTSPYIFLI